MTTTRQTGANETVTIGIVEQADGSFLALTFTASKTFKTLAGATRFLARRGYRADGQRL